MLRKEVDQVYAIAAEVAKKEIKDPLEAFKAEMKEVFETFKAEINDKLVPKGPVVASLKTAMKAKEFETTTKRK